ncbi:MAG TPA: flippase [Allosphingosinicella sp.]|jgi:O-antigen/teichoic acid export membrane protein
MSLSRNATYSAIAATLPSVLTLVTVPLYLHFVGVERYGVLALCWVFLAYSAFMDLGLGLAVARRIAQSRDGDGEDAAEALWTAIWLSLGLGLAAGAAVYAGGLYYFGNMAKVAPTFRSEVAAAIPLMAAAVPVLMLSGVLSGALQGRERFLALNSAQVLGNALGAVLPLVLAYFWSPVLPVLVAGALLGRLVPVPLLFALCRRAVPLRGISRPSGACARSLLGFGGWVSLTTIAVAVLSSADRLMIGGMIGAAAVSVYTIPYNLMSRIYIVPHSLSPVLFPRFAWLDESERQNLVLHGLQTIAAIVTPLLIGAVMLVKPFFTLWIGPELTQAALPLSYMFAVGFWFYCIGYPAIGLLQATGRPDLVSKLFLAQIVPFIGANLLALSMFGLVGAVLVFLVRLPLEAIALVLLARIPWSTLKPLVVPAGLTVSAVLAAWALDGFERYPVLLALLAAATLWSAIHAPAAIRNRLGRFARFLPGSRS